MKINMVQPTTFGSGVKIRVANNKNHAYLYNEIMGITNEFKIPATFRTPEIDLPSVSKEIISKLEMLGIKFSDK